jgi:hypothetical protein
MFGDSDTHALTKRLVDGSVIKGIVSYLTYLIAISRVFLIGASESGT